MQKKTPRFDVLGVCSVIADFRGGESDDLPCVGWIGQDFLIAAHAGVEDDFPHLVGWGAEGHPVEDGSVRKGEERLPFPLRLPFRFQDFKIHTENNKQIPCRYGVCN